MPLMPLYPLSQIAVMPTPDKSAVLLFERAIPANIRPYYRAPDEYSLLSAELHGEEAQGDFDGCISKMLDLWHAALPMFDDGGFSLGFERFDVEHFRWQDAVREWCRTLGPLRQRNFERWKELIRRHPDEWLAARAYVLSLYLARQGFDALPVLVNFGECTVWRSLATYAKETLPKIWKNFSEEYQTEISLLDFPGMDCRRLHWNEVFEIRRDEQSLAKLRRLRNFMFEHMTGKPKSYIHDRLSLMLDDYKMACKKHDIELVNSSLTIVLNSKSLLAASALAFGAAVAGEPLAASASLAGGVSVELAKLALNYTKRRAEFAFDRDHSVVAYILDLAKRLGNGAA